MVANTWPAPKPAFKVAGDSPGRVRGRRHGLLVDEPPRNPWEPYRLKLLSKKINGRWYMPGSWVYRKWMVSPGGGYWKYGDDFDFMRGK